MGGVVRNPSYFQGALSVSEGFFEIDMGKALELPRQELDLVERTTGYCLTRSFGHGERACNDDQFSMNL